MEQLPERLYDLASKELPDRLRDISRNHWLSDDEARTLNFAAHQLEHLKKHLGIQKSYTKVAQFHAEQKDAQVEEAHRILTSDAVKWLIEGGNPREGWNAQLLSALTEYRSKYGNAYGEAAPF